MDVAEFIPLLIRVPPESVVDEVYKQLKIRVTLRTSGASSRQQHQARRYATIKNIPQKSIIKIQRINYDVAALIGMI